MLSVLKYSSNTKLFDSRVREALVSWVLLKIKKRDPLRYLHFWISRGPLGMGIVLYK